MADDRDDYVLREITPLTEGEVLFIADRHKKEFTFPVHTHDAFELNFVEGGEGVQRVVGDSVETIGALDLALIASPDLEHTWLQGACRSSDIYELTVQFRLDDGPGGMLSKSPFAPIRQMLRNARGGLAFPTSGIAKVYNKLHSLASIGDSFTAFISFLEILNTLAACREARQLATTSYSKLRVEEVSAPVLAVKNYIDKHYMDELPLGRLAELACMSETGFSRYFRQATSRTVSEYIADVRLGNAARLLLDTDRPVADISFACGFNNLSNFNRTFKRRKGSTPTEFREYYHKIRIIL